ncbi:acyl-CoA dehydrogenase family protein [Streptomyces sp. NPDC057702]|uniref:acyl-CoA dehydrogenase family protein n=1 Tax=unclassified Streptomyces TaxID=2593676 RepID=UPI0036C1AFAF
MTTLPATGAPASPLPVDTPPVDGRPVETPPVDGRPVETPPAVAGPDPTTAELTRLLFGPDRDRVHGPWRALAAEPDMQRRTEAATADQLADSYRRLRRLATAADPATVAADPHLLAALHEWMAPVDGALTVLAGIHYNLFLGSLYDHDQRPDRPLDDFLRTDRIGTFLCTELDHGNDAAALETVATYDRTRRTFTLHTPHPGARKFMPNTGPAGGPKSGLVAARLLVDDRDHGIFLFLVPLTDTAGPLPGVSVHPLPLRPGSPVDHCLTSFDNVVLPRAALLTGEHGRLTDDATVTSAFGGKRKRFLAAIGRVSVGKLCMAASAIGGARTALATAVRYAHHRHVTGARPDRRVPLWAHRTHHGPLLEALATVYAMTALHRVTVDRWARRTPADADAVERQVAISKGWTTWRARDVIVESRERCGAQGLLPVNGFAALLGDVEGTITAEGDNLALWAKAGAELLLTADPGTPAATTAAADRAPTAAGAAGVGGGGAEGHGGEVGVGAVGGAGRTGGGDMDDAAFRQALLASVVRLRLSRARVRMRTSAAGDRLRRWNAAAPDALAAVTARAEHDAAAALLDWVAATDAPQVRDLLLDLHRLFTLRRIEHASGLLVGAGELTAAQAADLAVLPEEAIDRLAGHGLTLVAAFDLPEEFLGQRPIATPAYVQALLARTRPRPAPRPVTAAFASADAPPGATDARAEPHLP